jgi:hypothetical protein
VRHVAGEWFWPRLTMMVSAGSVGAFLSGSGLASVGVLIAIWMLMAVIWFWTLSYE